MRRSLSNVIVFLWNKRKETRQEKTTKKQGKINKKARKNQKQNKKQNIERDREWKKKWKKPRRKKETLRNEQNNPLSGVNGVFVKNKKTQNTKKGWRPTTPKHTCRVFLLSLWSPHGHASSSYPLFIAKVSLILFFTFDVLFFFFLVVVFCFFVSIFVFIVVFVFDFVVFLFCIFLGVTKKPDQITEYLKCSFWCSALVPASSHFHLAQLRTPTRTREPPLKMVFDSFL